MIVYQSPSVNIEGSNTELMVSDNNTAFLLNKMLKELIKTNIHLSISTDEIIENEDIEV